MTAAAQAKTLFWGNIAVIIGAVLTLVWNAAVMTARFESVESSLARVRAVQSSVVLEQERIGQKITSVEQRQQLLDGRIFRLEDLGLQRAR